MEVRKMKKKLFLIQEFETVEERDKALRKISVDVPCYFSDSENSSRSWTFVS